MPDIYSVQNDTAGGFHCQRCGEFINANSFHVCPKIGSYFNGQYYPNYTEEALIERIAIALEKIAAHLTTHALDQPSAEGQQRENTNQITVPANAKDCNGWQVS